MYKQGTAGRPNLYKLCHIDRHHVPCNARRLSRFKEAPALQHDAVEAVPMTRRGFGLPQTTDDDLVSRQEPGRGTYPAPALPTSRRPGLCRRCCSFVSIIEPSTHTIDSAILRAEPVRAHRHGASQLSRSARRARGSIALLDGSLRQLQLQCRRSASPIRAHG